MYNATMSSITTTHVYIDGVDLDKGTSESGWRIDYVKFHKWLLEDKFNISNANRVTYYLPQ